MVQIQKGAIRPLKCYSEAWHALKDHYWLFFAIVLVGMLIASLAPLAILMGPMLCGIYICIFKRLRGESVDFVTLFKGFEFFAQSLIATMLVVAASLVIVLPSYAIYMYRFFKFMAYSQSLHQTADPFQNKGLFYGLLKSELLVFAVIFGFSFLVGVFFAFVYPLVAEARLSALQAISASFRGVMSNLWGSLALVLIGMVLTIVGLAFCCVGAYVIAPFTFTSWAVAYTQVFKTTDA